MMYLQAKTLSLVKKKICDSTLSPYWNNDLPPTTQRGSKDCIQTMYGDKSSLYLSLIIVSVYNTPYSASLINNSIIIYSI